MPHKDLEKRREYRRKYYAEHREVISAQNAASNRKNPERVKAAQRRYKERHYDENQEAYLARSRAHYQAHREQKLKYAKEYRLALPPDERHRRQRQNKLITKYKIRPEWYETTRLEQGDACAICGTLRSRKYLDIDHCHRTGQVRGLLCRTCNVAIHKMDQSIEWAEKAVAYLKRTSELTRSPV